MVWLHGTTIFLSSFLLFLVQPMFARGVLPLLGGTPGVWNTCMMFFQGALLAGYCYAHAGPRWLGAGRHASLHAGLALSTGCALLAGWATPAGVPGWAGEPGSEGNPTLWLLGALAGGVGLPFFALAATNPLLQAWFSRSGHRLSGDPYFLYSASNAGSLLALAAYPTLVEPNWGLGAQAAGWRWAFMAWAVLMVCCRLASGVRGDGGGGGSGSGSGAGSGSGSGASGVDEGGDGERIGWGRAGRWVVLAAIPSSLTLGATTHITTDVASVPLLWIIPLGLYLLSLIIPFSRTFGFPVGGWTWFGAGLLLLLGASSASSRIVPLAAMPAHLGGVFVAGLMCHGLLAEDRPGPRHLTAFYLWMALGGALGGALNGALAPAVLPGVWEYPLMLAAAVYALGSNGRFGGGARRLAVGCAAGLVLGSLVTAGREWAGEGGLERALRGAGWGAERAERFASAAGTGVLAAGALAGYSMARRYPAGAALTFLAIWWSGVWGDAWAGRDRALFAGRGFFGALRVTENGGYHILSHGTTYHGVQRWTEGRGDCEPLTYYHRRGPLGALLGTLAERGASRELGVVGLGAGTAAAYQADGWRTTFFEIDPLVVRIARDRRLFTYLTDCAGPGGAPRIAMGDGRLGTGREPDGKYGLILVDAFGSDAIPTHLLTREAVEVYQRKLAPGGLLALHVTNRYLDLTPIAARIAAETGWVCRAIVDVPDGDAERYTTRYAVMGRRDEDFGGLREDPRWRLAEVPAGTPLWTDDRVNLLWALKRRR